MAKKQRKPKIKDLENRKSVKGGVDTDPIAKKNSAFLKISLGKGNKFLKI